jgi:hypothetical protein
MDKSFVIFVAVGIGFLYLITNFVGDIEKDDGYNTTSEYSQEAKYDKYIGSDSIGRAILKLEGISKTTQIDVWNHSKLKEECLSYYPDYDEIKKFIKERVVSQSFQKFLLDNVTQIEKDFLMGKIDSDQALRKLESL